MGEMSPDLRLHWATAETSSEVSRGPSPGLCVPGSLLFWVFVPLPRSSTKLDLLQRKFASSTFHLCRISLITLYNTMTLNAHHENLVLVAPRPVRLAAPVPYSQFHSTIVQRPQPKSTTIRFVSSPSDAFEKLKLGDDPMDDDAKSDWAPPAEREISVSPRASPR